MTDYGFAMGGYGADSSCERYSENAWTARANLAVPRKYLQGFALNGFSYVVGGYDLANVDTKTTQKFDDVTNSWAIKADINVARRFTGGFSLKGFGYTVGGYAVFAFSDVNEKYDDVADSWTVKANLINSGECRGFMLNDYGYAVGLGGWCNKYDDAGNFWIVRASLLQARHSVATFELNNFGYAAGGGFNSTIYNNVEKYDDVANTWTNKAVLNTGRAMAGAFKLGNYGYVMGGRIWVVFWFDPVSVNERYDDVANSWVNKASLSIARWGPGESPPPGPILAAPVVVGDGFSWIGR